MSIFTSIRDAIEGEFTTITTDISDLEKKLLPSFEALVKMIESTIGAQGVTILEQGMADIATVIANGGNVGTAIGALIPQVTSQVTDDLKQDANTAAHGAVELLVANLAVPVAAPAVVPAVVPTPAPETPPAA